MIELYNENCFKTLSLLDENSIDLVITSPPYNTSKKRGTWSKEQKTHYDLKCVDSMGDEDYIDFSTKLFEEIDSALTPNGVILYNISYSTEKPNLIYSVINSIMEKTNFTIANTIIWKKTNALPNNMSVNRLTRICEFVFVFCRKSEMKTFHMNKEVLSVRKNGIKQYTTYWNFIEAKNNDGSNKLNKATFSSELVEKLLEMYAPEDCYIYDPFMGTGTTAVACERTGRHCIGSELSTRQVLFSIKRLKGEFDYLDDESLYFELNDRKEAI